MSDDHKIARDAAKEAGLDLADFIRLGDQVIGYANHSSQENRKPKGVNLAILYGIARYGAFLGRGLKEKEREAYVSDMSERFAAMMREHFADTSLTSTKS
jgi:hypothetical protein